MDCYEAVAAHMKDGLNFFDIESLDENSFLGVSRDNFTDEECVVSSFYRLDKLAFKMRNAFFNDGCSNFFGTHCG